MNLSTSNRSHSIDQAHEDVEHTQLPLVVYDPPVSLPDAEQPSARLLRDGPAACSTLELLQVILGGPQAERAARELLAHCRDLRSIALRSPHELATSIYGLGEKKAALVKACLELGKRMMTHMPEARPQIKTPADAARLLMPEIGHLEQEEVWVLLLDARNRMIGMSRIYRGNLNSANMRVNELFREAIRNNAASIVLSHNHPSQDCSASSDDVFVTKEVVKAGKLLDIDCVDHLICCAASFYSLKEHGLGFE